MSFTGFTQEGLDLLERLPGLDREAFQGAAPTYRAGLAEPAKAFVETLGPMLRTEISHSIDYGAHTNQSIAPINNDRRFHPSAPPYKDHLLFRFWEGADKRSGSTLFVRITPGDVGFAVGMQFPSPRLDAYRSAVDHDGDGLADAVRWLVRHRSAGVVGATLKRVPAPFPADHPHADLLRHKALQIRWRVDPGGVLTKARLATFCRDQLARGAGVHRWLVEHVA